MDPTEQRRIGAAPDGMAWVESACKPGAEERVSAIEERGYRSMVEEQGDQQIDTWAADLFIDFAKRMGVGTAIAAFCDVASLDAKGFQRVFLVAGGPDHVVGIDTAGALAAPIFELPRAIAGLRRTDPETRKKRVAF